MAGVNVSVAPEIINWVIEKIQFGTVNNSVFELLNKWKSGEKVPTFNQIEDVSKKTNIPFGYFFLEKTDWIILPLMQNFKHQFPQDIAIAHRTVLHAFRLCIGRAYLADNLQGLHSAVAAHGGQVFASLPRRLQIQKRSDAMLRFFGGIIGHHQVGEETEK